MREAVYLHTTLRPFPNSKNLNLISMLFRLSMPESNRTARYGTRQVDRPDALWPRSSPPRGFRVRSLYSVRVRARCLRASAGSV